MSRRRRKRTHNFARMILSLSLLALLVTLLVYASTGNTQGRASGKGGNQAAGNGVSSLGTTIKDGITGLAEYFTGEENNMYDQKTTSTAQLTGIDGYATGIYGEVYSHIDTFTEVSHRKLKIDMSNYGNYRLTNDGTQNFSVLQVTDVHLTGSDISYAKDIQALDAVYSMIARTQPDFIVMTGDLIFGTDGYATADGMRAWNVLSNVMDRIGIPWTWTFGNHDHSFFDRFTTDEVGALLNQCNTLCMYPDGSEYGYSNGVIELCNTDGSLAMGLVTIDTNNELVDAAGNAQGYDYVHPDQVEWYAREIAKLNAVYGENVKTLLYSHIPVEEYDAAWNMIDGRLAGESIWDGTHTATYIYGKKREAVQGSSVESTLFEKALELKSTVAIFCGHDHLNDYDVDLDGIQLVYGKSIDYIAYPGIEFQTEQRGATLVSIDAESGFAIIPLNLE